jgi:hypothetical protein
MNYNDSITDFFKSPHWKMNCLLGAVSIFIPIVGPIVLAGWHVSILWGRGDEEEPANYPAFDFQYFGKYLERGLWPFLVSLVVSVAMVPLMMICLMAPLLFFGISAQASEGQSQGFPIIMFGFMFMSYLVIMFGFNLLLVPMMLRATITQDFGSAFNPGFAKSFLSRTWKELLVSVLFMFGLSLCLMVLAVITCYIGAIFAAPVVIFSWHHLQKQLYQLYLARGGEPVPLSPTLQNLPPPLPPPIFS